MPPLWRGGNARSAIETYESLISRSAKVAKAQLIHVKAFLPIERLMPFSM
jgi:hypothetical protein